MDTELDFAEDILAAIEKHYGRSIYRIPKFKKTGRTTFEISIIFMDFRLLEATLQVVVRYGQPAIDIQGTYY